MNKEKNFLKKLMKKREKGITLIALVITIIVLLILAGVTINAITGNESAMEKAQQARTENEQANELDSIKLAVVDAVAKGDNGKVSKDKLAESLEGLIEGDIEGGDTNPWTVKGKITKKEYTITENGNVTETVYQTVAEAKETEKELSTSGVTTLKDELGNKVKVPKNFKIAEDSGVNVADGVVIEDRKGNQFVWVPVGEVKKAGDVTVNITLGRYDDDYQKTVKDLSNGYVQMTLEEGKKIRK